MTAMGLGTIGTSSNKFKRQFRWTLKIYYCYRDGEGSAGFGYYKSVSSDFVKISARPKITMDETQVDHLHGRFWIPGKGVFDDMTITYYDVVSDVAVELFGWLASVYDFTDPVNLTMGASLGDYEGLGELILYDGCGSPIEAWHLQHMWPKSVDFGELNMESSEICLVSLTVKYSQVSYFPYCTATIDKCPCTPCTA